MVFQRENEGAGHVPHMDKRPFEMLFIDDEVPLFQGAVDEIIDEEVEPEAVGHPKRRREPVNHGARLLHDLLGTRLGNAIGREGIELRALGAEIAEDGAVIAPRRSIIELLVFLRQLDDVTGDADVDLFGKLRLALARGISDQRREMNDSIPALDRLLDDLPIPQVRLPKLKILVGEARQKPPPAKHQRVDHPDRVPLLKKFEHQPTAHVPRTACH